MPKRMAGHEVKRAHSIGMALEVPTAELDEVLAGMALAEARRSYGSPLVDFAGRHGVWIDFFISGRSAAAECGCARVAVMFA
jgi:hypothetical protein